MSALALIDYEPTLYFNAIPNSIMAIMRERWEQEEREEREAEAAKGIVREPDPEPEFEMGTPDDEIGAAIDVRSATDAKYDALAAHHSQVGESFWMKMSRDEFRRSHGHRVVRARDEPQGTCRERSPTSSRDTARA